MEVISYINFIIIMLLLGVLIYQSLLISDVSKRMDSYDSSYGFDNKRFNQRYSDMNKKVDGLTQLAVMQQTELMQLPMVMNGDTSSAATKTVVFNTGAPVASSSSKSRY